MWLRAGLAAGRTGLTSHACACLPGPTPQFEEGEVCPICGHCLPTAETAASGSLPSEVLPGFLYLGSYDDSMKLELLKAMGVSCVLNCVPACQNKYNSTFEYFRASTSPPSFEECLRYLDACREGGRRVLVHCMSGRNVAPTVCAAYLMYRMGWGAAASLEWLRERWPRLHLKEDSHSRLKAFDTELGPREAAAAPAWPAGGVVGGLTPGIPSFPMLFASKPAGNGR